MKNSTARKLRQIPTGYLLVGVDPHSKKHAAVALTREAVVHTKFKFANSREGYEDALERVRAVMVKAGCRGVMFAIETVDIIGATWPTSWRTEACLSGSSASSR